MDELEQMHEEPRVTTVADSAWKGRIEPYSANPALDIPTGVIACSFCGNTRFRRSRVRLGDVRELFLLRLPLRCMRCNQRQYGSCLTAALAVGTRSHGLRLARGKDTWKSWTEQEVQGKLHRPMTTALGPRATKLNIPVREEAAQVQEKRRGEESAWRDGSADKVNSSSGSA